MFTPDLGTILLLLVAIIIVLIFCLVYSMINTEHFKTLADQQEEQWNNDHKYFGHAIDVADQQIDYLKKQLVKEQTLIKMLIKDKVAK